MSFAENLQYLRKRDRITQEELADYLQVSRQSISKWETGEAYPETEKLFALCDKFEVSLDALLRGNLTPSAEKITGCENIEGKCVCKACGNTYLGNFCPNCGTPNGGVYELRRVISKAAIKRAVEILGIVSGLLCALACMVFVFFTGFSIKGEAQSDQMVAVVTGNNVINYFYFFGDAYDQLSQEVISSVFDISRFAYYQSAVLLTVVGAVTIASTAVFFVLSAVSAVRKFMRIGGQRFSVLVALTFCSYIFGVVVLHGFGIASADIAYTGSSLVGAEAHYVLNGATIAGIVVGSSFLLLERVLCAVNGFKLTKSVKNICAYAVCIAGAVVAAAMLAVLAYSCISFNMSFKYSAVTMTLSGNSPVSELCTIVISAFGNSTGEYVRKWVTGFIETCVWNGFIAHLSIILACLCTAVWFGFALCGKGKTRFVELALSLICVALSVTAYVCADRCAFAGAQAMPYVSGDWTSKEVTFSASGTLAPIVLSSVGAVVSVIRLFLPNVSATGEN
ncbi:MAG: helix-turn-helix domain-containing protein [Candidatus Coproplasma sp.]